ncbi:MAG: NADH-quinone oxidoreductase subunit C [Candidatus Nitrohelix vancouverensis]|uniref:NADH-quinone oxidoreductase subunit C n=1 Tax=Candidatus Nitrohelix vancouverensis TaxID=2705534 RepID=A0A7T0C4U4_9BACT|nr:MAG: NADH-quinone oxidoreductase subunit C [Candidatus Nitrohelix vancouverensis]
MTSEEIVEKIKNQFGDAVLLAETPLGDAVVHVAPESLVAVAEFAKNDPDLSCDYLSNISGVDYLDMDREPRFESVYELHSLDKNHSLRLRVGIDEEDPVVPTVSGLWKGAVFPERELYDLFGIRIEGLPEQRRLIMPENWEGHPLRRDYELTVEDVAFSFNRDYKSELVKTKPPTR